VSLTKTLLKSFTKKAFSLADYKDEYIENLRTLIEAKAAGKELVSPPQAEEPHVISLMDALKKSVAQVQRGAALAEERPSRRRMAPSGKRAKSAAKARRKSG